MNRIMRTPSIWALLLSGTLALSIACADRSANEQPPAQNRDAPEQTHPETPEPEGTAGRPAPSENATPNFEPARPGREPSASPAAEPPTVVPGPVADPAPPDAAQKPAPQKAPAKDPIVLVGSPMGGVSFSHKAHVQHANNTCETCHHPSKPEKPLASPNQACRDCHTKTPAPPMKTTLQLAFHVPMAKSGTCIGCHQAENKKGNKKAPLKCQECHKKEIK
jgi:hypothetical protein